MDKKYLFVAAIIMLFLLTGCETYQTQKEKWFGSEVIISEEPINKSKPIVSCNCGEEFDAAIYYFNNDINSGLKTFIENSDDFLYCSLVRLDSDSFNNILLEKDLEVELKLLFDKKSTMDCTSACIPYSYSQFNFLYGEGIDIKVYDDIHQNFCVSEDGLFLTSRLFDKSVYNDNALYLKSDGLREVYVEQFNNMWGRG